MTIIHTHNGGKAGADGTRCVGHTGSPKCENRCEHPSTHNGGKAGADGARCVGHAGPLGQAVVLHVPVTLVGEDAARLNGWGGGAGCRVFSIGV